LGGEELIGIVRSDARGILADHAWRGLAVDVDGGGGFVDGSEARRHHDGGDDGDEDEGQIFHLLRRRIQR
jgi:hypothetical protein